MAQFMAAASCGTFCRDASDYASAQLSNGSWADIDYADKSRAGWKPAAHWSRMVTLGASMRCGNQTPDSAVPAFHRAASFWFKRRPKSENWWYMELYQPMTVGQAYVLAYDHLLPDEISLGVEIMYKAEWQTGPKSTWSGQNNQWGQEAEARRAAVTNNVSAADEAFSAMWAAVTLIPANANPDNGIHADGSFHQHGPLLQSGTYGAAYTGDVLALLPLVSGLRWDLSGPARRALIFYALEGQRPAVRWNGRAGSGSAATWDVLAKGREITRPPEGSLPFETSWASGLALLAPKGTQRAAEVSAWSASFSGRSGEPFSGAKHFWLSDYLTVSAGDSPSAPGGFSVGVRMHSTRTFSAECVNEENLQGWHQGAGWTSVRRAGDEYNRGGSVFPVWNYTLLPGVTARQGAGEKECGTVKQMGLSAFVGGLGDGVWGLAAYDQVSNDFGGAGESTPLRARKSYLVTAGTAAGAGLLSLVDGASLPTGQPVATTLTSTMLALPGDSDALPAYGVGTGAPRTLPNGSYELDASPAWVSHDGVVYAPIGTGNGTAPAFPSPITVVNGPVNGSWRRISTSQSDAVVSRHIFTAALAHGALPRSGLTFAFAALPSGAGAKAAGAAAEAAQESLTAVACALESGGAEHRLTAPGGAGLVRFPADSVAPLPASPCAVPAEGGVALSNASDASAWLARVGGSSGSQLFVSATNPLNKAMSVTAFVSGVVASSTTPLLLLGGTDPANYVGLVEEGEWAGSGVTCTPHGGGTLVSATLPGGVSMAGASVTGECAISSRFE